METKIFTAQEARSLTKAAFKGDQYNIIISFIERACKNGHYYVEFLSKLNLDDHIKKLLEKNGFEIQIYYRDGITKCYIIGWEKE